MDVPIPPPVAPLMDAASRSDAPFGDGRRRTTLVTGSVALGAVVTGGLLRKISRQRLREPGELPKALDAAVGEMEMMEGRLRFYERPGVGTPVVFLHTFDAAGSSHELKPIFEHLAATTRRPLYAIDWLGFGLSDRPPVRYAPALYQRGLRRFLSEQVHQPADLVALSLSCEYAASVAHQFPYLVRKLVGISPTALSTDTSHSLLQRAAVDLASSLGAFEIFYYRLTTPDHLRRFYQRHIFQSGTAVPDALVQYAALTTRVRGAHHAPRYFVNGSLFLDEVARETYRQLPVPTLFIAPERSEGLIQQFDLLDDVLRANAGMLQAERLRSGLLPQWDAPEELFTHLDRFLAA